MSEKTVMLIEDDEDNRKMYATVLEQHGYRIIQADNGADGVRLASDEHPDLIIMNLSIPVINGAKATEHLKHDPQTTDIPIIVLTGHSSPGVQNQAWEAGCDDYLLKPLEPSRLLEEVEVRIGPATSFNA